MDRINPLKLLEDNKMLGGFSLKQIMFRHHHSKMIFEAWKALDQLLSEKKIEPIVDSEWSFEEVRSFWKGSNSVLIEREIVSLDVRIFYR